MIESRKREGPSAVPAFSDTGIGNGQSAKQSGGLSGSAECA
jgi:hypothetical protein